MTHPYHLCLLGWGGGVLQVARAERRSQWPARVNIHSLQALVAVGNDRFMLCKGQTLEVMNPLEHSMEAEGIRVEV